MELIKDEEILYVIAVYGYAPEFWPAIAYRRSGKREKAEESERHKEIKCPYCGKLFMVVSVKRRLDLIRFKKREKAGCHEYRKCRICHENVGIVYLSDKTA